MYTIIRISDPKSTFFPVFLEKNFINICMDITFINESQEWARYRQEIGESISLPADSTVAEIAVGNFGGAFYNKISNSKIKKYIAIEPNTDWYLSTKSCNYNNIQTEFINSTYENYIPNEPVDIVICAGLAYHLHSPVHLIEYVANHFDPAVIYFETTGHINPSDPDFSWDHVLFKTEIIDIPGNAFKGNYEKKVSLSAVLQPMFIAKCFETIGYTLEKYYNFQSDTHSSKDCVCMMKIVKD